MTVKARYLQLSQVIEVKEEDFVLPQDSRYGDLLAAVRKKHPALTYVLMLALMNGTPPDPDTKLKDGDEVDFARTPVGG
jgi:molybdopterin converting factor small subunit